jgi:alkanesulfonate monooxygenase SsuD/methylene tetrahydromethanopterin reductase-like flavin-dependent oxidoreductase (luciferase family)
MKIGLSISPEFAIDESPLDGMRERLALVRSARDAGIHSITMGEHYLSTPHPCYQNIPFLGRVAAEAEGMDIYAFVVLSLHHPIEIAEQAATLDIISGGRFRLAVGLGWRQTEFQTFQVPKEHRVSHFLEQIALIRKCWTERDFTFDGRFYQIAEPVSSLPPLQMGGPPILLGPSSERMARRVAQVGDGWMGSGHTTWAGMVPLVAAYDDELRRLGKSRPAEFSIIRHCYVARDRETALREVAPYIELYYQQFGGWGLFRDIIRTGGPDVPDLSAMLEGRVIFGSPDDVASELRRYRDEFGVNHVHCRVGWQGMDSRLVHRAVELLGQEVLPQVA